VRAPLFDSGHLQAGILHLGCGAFHRAHQAVFTQAALNAGNRANPEPWGIIAASLLRPIARDRLRPQDNLYTVLERGHGGVAAEVIGTLRQVLYAREHLPNVIDRFADPAIRIVTLTVTPSGYCIDPATGRLCPDRPEIQADLRSDHPGSVPGLITAGLDRVRELGLQPPVLISCDNLPRNGSTLRQAVVDFAAMKDDALAGWIARTVQFPSSVVDRIVPSAGQSDAVDARRVLGLSDQNAVSAEPFRQWVLEHFDGPRPLWECGGAEFVSDVSPWEASKLRLLNGTHLAIAFLGALAGMRTVAEFVAEPAFSAYAMRLMLDEQKPTIPPSDHDIAAYAHQLLQRWRNPEIAHQLTRVGRNGSEKLEARLLAPIRENLRFDRPIACACLAVAAWICCMHLQATGRSWFQFEDPLLDAKTLRCWAKASPEEAAAVLLENTHVFGDDLPRSRRFREAIGSAVSRLAARGPHAAVSSLLVEGACLSA
jgi:fructuronate reductase